MKYQTVLYDLDYFLSQILHILIQQDSQYEHAQLMYFPSFLKYFHSSMFLSLYEYSELLSNIQQSISGYVTSPVALDVEGITYTTI